ncbi:hypothetical protein [Rhizobium sp. ZW T2_16]|uniref:hypothetical protein n=1 Tax=Rhizobium sp. ZW T2_16 TaxID=3378083 RepID=UPI0038542411
MVLMIPTVHPQTAEKRILASFAQRARGMTGADVEAVVRQAKRTARREGRPLAHADVERALDSIRPMPPEAFRWRFAHHEAGHVIIGMVFGFTDFDQITLNDGNGNPSVTAAFFVDGVATEERIKHLIIVGLAGRAAEELIFGDPSVYAGGGRSSDLARVTKLAYLLETSFGFGKEHKLVYRECDDFVAGIAAEPGLIDRISRRLELSFPVAFHLLDLHRDAVEYLAKELMKAGTLDGAHLKSVLNEVQAIIDRKIAARLQVQD